MTAAQTPIVTFQDILDAIAQNPELKEEMRRHLQDEELRNLPQTVALLAQNLQELTAIVQAMAERQARMEGDIAELKDGQTRMEERQTQMEGTLNRLSGTDYERRIARSLRRNSQRYFGISSAQLLHSVILPNNNPLPDLLDQACDAGAITAEEASQAERVDLVIVGHDSDDGIRYAVIEASVNVDRSDVTRALARSQIVARATGHEAVPAVAGAAIPDAVRQYAADQGVTAVVIPAE